MADSAATTRNLIPVEELILMLLNEQNGYFHRVPGWNLNCAVVGALRRLLFSPHLRSGNAPALFADLTKEYGPVFEIRPPFAKPMIFLAGPETRNPGANTTVVANSALPTE